MPKSLYYEGLIALSDTGERVLKHYKVEHHPVARARVSQRLVRAALERRPDLAVWVGGRLYVLDERRTLHALADELGVLQPPVAASPSSMNVAA